MSAPVERIPLGTLNLLGLLFVAFKLLGVISWPWLWVLAPFWFTFALAAAMLIFAGIIMAAGAISKAIDK